MVYGYARVSSQGQNLEQQESELGGVDILFEEKFTGMKRDRPQLNKLLNTVQAGDTVVVTKLDRLARSARDGIEIIDELTAKGVTINIRNMGIFDSTPSGKLMRTIMLAFAEFERDMIVQRTSEGREIAKANNPDYREGRKPKFEIAEKIKKDPDFGVVSVSELCRRYGISRSTYYKYGL